MSVRGYSEYSEDELEVVRLIGADGLIVWPNSRLKLGRSHARAMKWVLALGLATQDNRDATRYDLTRKGRKLLRQMERDEKRAAQHRDEHKFRAQISGHEVFKSAEIVLRSTDGTLFSDRTFLSREYNVILTPVVPEPPSSDRYPMCADQPAQIDCRRSHCRFHDGAGKCTNSSPAITLNGPPTMNNEKGVCWSYEECEPKPEPLCPVCGKPAAEHRDGLFCCGHCGREVRLIESGGLHQARCQGAICGIASLWYRHSENARAAWNRRA